MIGRMTTEGTVTAFSSGLSGRSNLEYLVAGTDGNLWFTDDGTPAIGRIAVVESAAQPPSIPPSSPTPDTGPGHRLTPVVRNARESARVWREGKALARISRRHKPPVGTIFSFSVSEPATVRFAFAQAKTGRRGGKRCLARAGDSRGPACTRTVTLAALTFTGHPGTNKVGFAGRISRSKKLAPGTYTLTITATNATGRSAPVRLNFTILR
jgi:hypothetical protein